MTEISSHKMVVYKYDNNNCNKISSTIPSKLYKTNRTLAFNDSNNIKTNSSLFTNEFLIKSIVNNNTSPYNSFYPKKKQYSKKLIFWEDKYHKKTIKNKLLLTNNSSINFNGTKSYLNRFPNTFKETIKYTDSYIEFVKFVSSASNIKKITREEINEMLESCKSTTAKDFIIKFYNWVAQNECVKYGHLQRPEKEAKPLKAYSSEVLIDLAEVLFSEKYDEENRLTEKALNNPTYAELWLYIS